MDSINQRLLADDAVVVTAPCRIDFGGTLDIRTFNLPLRHLRPCTVNIAIDLRTRVRLFPHTAGRVKISSTGFDTAEFDLDAAPFRHPLGLMFAIAAYFRAGGLHIDIESSSPPRSALGGSSVAAVALIAGLSRLRERAGGPSLSRDQIALLAHGIEESVAGVPCGLQDQLAAAYGGAHIWHWPAEIGAPAFEKEPLVDPAGIGHLERRLIVAYCGVPHESKDINGRWVDQFLAGKHRKEWAAIIACTKKFIDSVKQQNYKGAAAAMAEETAIRRGMTPDVFDAVGSALAESALKHDCGARFTGAGGGGCVWALGEIDPIARLRSAWEEILSTREAATLLPVTIDQRGLRVESAGADREP